MSGRDLQEVARSARRTAHSELPSLEQIDATIGKLRKGRNTKVFAQSKWETLVLDQKLLARIKLISELLRDAERWAVEGVSIPRSLLLQGPAGSGKTEVGRTLANESGLAFFSATTADIKANFLGQSGNRVKQVFERARAHAPCILFLDELDIIAPERSLGEDDPLTREIVGQLLQEIDGVQVHPEHVFLLGATNRSESVDMAVLSRFAERLQIPLPDHAARMRLLTNFLRDKKLDFSLEDGTRLLADLTEGKALSGRDLRSWVASAEQNALVRAFENGGPEQYVITLDDFSSAS
jgi:SpoVK/Ycf46/Vps4 family AAA+-type ATPase